MSLAACSKQNVLNGPFWVLKGGRNGPFSTFGPEIPSVVRVGVVSASRLSGAFCYIVAVFEGWALLPLAGCPVFLGCCLLRCYCHCVP